MPRNTNPMSKWYEQYAKEYKRVTQIIRRQEKIGYTVPDSLRPIKPSKLQVINKTDVQKLTKITPEKIRKASYYTDPSGFGETYYGLDVVKPRNNKKTAKPKRKSPSTKNKRKPKNPKNPTPPPAESEELDTFWYNDDIGNVPVQHRQYYPGFAHIAITGFYTQLRQFPSAEGARLIGKWFSDIIDRYGRDAAAEMLDVGSRNGLIVDAALVYDKRAARVWNYMTQMMDFLPGVDIDDKKRMSGILETLEPWETVE